MQYTKPRVVVFFQFLVCAFADIVTVYMKSCITEMTANSLMDYFSMFITYQTWKLNHQGVVVSYHLCYSVNF